MSKYILLHSFAPLKYNIYSTNKIKVYIKEDLFFLMANKWSPMCYYF